jgi:hypothetical protein
MRSTRAIRNWAAAIGGALLAVGCQESQVSKGIPGPTFNPPQVARGSDSVKPLPSQPQALAQQQPSYVNGVPRTWIPTVKAHSWNWIIIHHTATPSGAMARIDQAHRAKGWECIGYDFVVGNGTDSRDGQVEVSPRWTYQMIGAHTKSDDNRFNKWGIGIVMVGNFDQTRPSPKQIQSISQLVAYLMKTYRIPPDRILAHRDTKATDCPGKYTSVAQIRQLATRALVAEGCDVPDGPELASLPEPDSNSVLPHGELLRQSPDAAPATVAGGE